MFSFAKNQFFRFSFLFFILNFTSSLQSSAQSVCENDSTIIHLSTTDDDGTRTHVIYSSAFDLDSGIVRNCSQQMLPDGSWFSINCQTAFWERTDTVKNPDGTVSEFLTVTGSASGWVNKLSLTFAYSASGKINSETSRTWNGTGWDSTYLKTYQYNSQDQEILTETYSKNSGVWAKNNLIEMNYISGLVSSKRFASGNTINAWQNDSLFNFNYSGPIRSSVEINYWDNVNTVWNSAGTLSYSLIHNDWSIHIDKRNPKILQGNLIFDSVAYELDTLENLVYSFNKVYTLAHPFPSDYYEFYTYSSDVDRVSSIYLTVKTISGDYFVEIFAPGDTMIAEYNRDVVNEMFYDSLFRLISQERYGGCTNPCGGSSQYSYDSTGFTTNTYRYNWTMVSDDYYYDSYSHYNNSTPAIVIPEWEKNIFTCDTSSYQPNFIIAGGCGPYQIRWSPSTGLSSDTVLNPLIEITDTTQYTILLTDYNGLTDTATFNVIPMFTSAELTVDSTGCGGSVTLSVPYNPNIFYAWYKNNLHLPGLNSNQIVVTEPGMYRVRVFAYHEDQYTNPVNCLKYSATLNITIPPVIRITEHVDLCNGSAFILPDGNIVELPGTYISTLQTNAGCDSIIETTVSIAELPTISSTVNPILCNGDSTLISISATGGTEPYLGTGTYSYPAGSYVITVTDSFGCKDTDTLTINEPVAISADAGAPLYLCSAGQIQLGGSPTAMGGTGNLTYLWTPGALLISDTDSNPIATINLSTIYHVLVTDANGCTASSDVHMQISNLIPPVITQSGNILNANSNAFNYNWYYNGILILSGNFPTVAATQDGDYGVIVSDAEGCNFTAPLFSYSLNSTDQLSAAINFSIYPNPVKGFFFIQLYENNPSTGLNIFDITGKKVYTASLNEMINRIDVSMLAAGLYTISINNRTAILYKQLIIERY